MHKKILARIGLFVLLFSLASCNDSSASSLSVSQSETTSIADEAFSRNNPEIFTSLQDAPRNLKAPFTILNADGTFFNQTLEDSSYDNMYLAIRTAGQNSNTRNRLQVQDANFLQIFTFQKASLYFIFDGDDYVGTSSLADCEAYGETHPNSYSISGTASEYKHLGRIDMPGSVSFDESELETSSGSYNYMFSDSGVTPEGTLNGFSYATCDVRLSEATYKRSEDGNVWNAYIFINLAANIHSDLGLIGTYNANRNAIDWKMTRNCNSSQHTAGTSSVERDAKFYVYQDMVVTSMDNYDQASKEYSGADDLHFEAVGLSDGWILNVTNLKTKEVFSFTDRHTDTQGNPLIENGEGKTQYFRALLAASYCPVVASVWNARCGAALRDVTFDHVELSRYIDDNIESYRQDGIKRYEFYPETEVFNHGYAQGADNASFDYGIRTEDGTYKSGNTYAKGDRFISFSCYYDDLD